LLAALTARTPAVRYAAVNNCPTGCGHPELAVLMLPGRQPTQGQPTVLQTLAHKAVTSANAAGTLGGAHIWHTTSLGTIEYPALSHRSANAPSVLHSPSLPIRRFLCGHPDPFRSVRDLGLVSPGRPGGSAGCPQRTRESGAVPPVCETVV